MKKTPDRIAVENCLQRTTKAGLGVADIAMELGIPIERVKSVVKEMRRAGQLISIDRSVGNLFRWNKDWAPKTKPPSTVVMGSVQIQVFEIQAYEPYVPPKETFHRARAHENKDCGSRRGNEVVPYSPPMSMCVGKLKDQISHEGFTV